MGAYRLQCQPYHRASHSRQLRILKLIHEPTEAPRTLAVIFGSVGRAVRHRDYGRRTAFGAERGIVAGCLSVGLESPRTRLGGILNLHSDVQPPQHVGDNFLHVLMGASVECEDVWHSAFNSKRTYGSALVP